MKGLTLFKTITFQRAGLLQPTSIERMRYVEWGTVLHRDVITQSVLARCSLSSFRHVHGCTQPCHLGARGCLPSLINKTPTLWQIESVSFVGDHFLKEHMRGISVDAYAMSKITTATTHGLAMTPGGPSARAGLVRWVKRDGRVDLLTGAPLH